MGEIKSLGGGHTHIFSLEYLDNILKSIGFELIESYISYDESTAWSGDMPIDAGLRYLGLCLAHRKA